MNGQVLEADKAVVWNLPDCAKVRSNPYDYDYDGTTPDDPLTTP